MLYTLGQFFHLTFLIELHFKLFSEHFWPTNTRFYLESRTCFKIVLINIEMLSCKIAFLYLFFKILQHLSNKYHILFIYRMASKVQFFYTSSTTTGKSINSKIISITFKKHIALATYCCVVFITSFMCLLSGQYHHHPFLPFCLIFDWKTHHHLLTDQVAPLLAPFDQRPFALLLLPA